MSTDEILQKDEDDEYEDRDGDVDEDGARLKAVAPDPFVSVRVTPLGNILREKQTDEERVYAILEEVQRARTLLSVDKSESVLLLLDIIHVQGILITRLVREREAAARAVLQVVSVLRTSTSTWFSPIERLAQVLATLRGTDHVETVRQEKI